MSGFIYKRKFYRNFFIRKYIRINCWLANRLDSAKDKKICGVSLVKYVPSKFRESMGATGSQSTRYWMLDAILRGEEFTADDSLFDVGCGKGRVLAYLISRKYPCKVTGIELNEEVAQFAKNWTDKYPNAEIINGSAFDVDYNDYTVLFMGRPFELETFEKFIVKLESIMKHPIKVYSWYDQACHFLDDRKGWKLEKRNLFFVSHGLFMFPNPQRYSVWIYTPDEE